MNPLSAIIEVMEPRAVMSVGSVVAFTIACLLTMQAYLSRGYRWSLCSSDCILRVCGMASGHRCTQLEQYLPIPDGVLGARDRGS
jgi:hypothetical protein